MEASYTVHESLLSQKLGQVYNKDYDIKIKASLFVLAVTFIY